MCRMMLVHPGGYYAWRSAPVTSRHKEDQRLTGLIKQFWLESRRVYGYRKVVAVSLTHEATASTIRMLSVRVPAAVGATISPTRGGEHARTRMPALARTAARWNMR